MPLDQGEALVLVADHDGQDDLAGGALEAADPFEEHGRSGEAQLACRQVGDQDAGRYQQYKRETAEGDHPDLRRHLSGSGEGTDHPGGQLVVGCEDRVGRFGQGQ